MVMKIKTRHAKLIEKLDKLRDDIEALQNECTHPNVTKEYKGDTGNWCRQDDYYWIAWKCPDCGKFWITPQ